MATSRTCGSASCSNAAGSSHSVESTLAESISFQGRRGITQIHSICHSGFARLSSSKIAAVTIFVLLSIGTDHSQVHAAPVLSVEVADLLQDDYINEPGYEGDELLIAYRITNMTQGTNLDDEMVSVILPVNRNCLYPTDIAGLIDEVYTPQCIDGPSWLAAWNADGSSLIFTGEANPLYPQGKPGPHTITVLILSRSLQTANRDFVAEFNPGYAVTSEIVPVPEVSTAGLLVLGSLSLLRRKHRRLV